MSSKAMRWTVGVIGVVLIAASMPRAAYADDRVSSQTLKQILQELNDLKAERARADKKIDDLEQKIETIQGQNQKLQEANQQLKSDTSQKIETLQTQVSTSTSRSAFE